MEQKKMPNANYVKGRKKEYKICKRLKEQGCDIVQRTAGSHSPIDIIAIDKEHKRILFVQSKPEGYSSKKYKEYEWLNDMFKVEFFIQ